MAPQVGLEPTTLRLTAECSAIELLRIVSVTRCRRAGSGSTRIPFITNKGAEVKGAPLFSISSAIQHNRNVVSCKAGLTLHVTCAHCRTGKSTLRNARGQLCR